MAEAQLHTADGYERQGTARRGLSRNLVLGKRLREATLCRLLVTELQRLAVSRVDVIHRAIVASANVGQRCGR